MVIQGAKLNDLSSLRKNFSSVALLRRRYKDIEHHTMLVNNSSQEDYLS